MVKTALMEQIPENVFIDRGPELPDSYGLRKMVAMVKNPYWIYVYWDLPAGDCARAGASGVRAAVKIYDLTDDVAEVARAGRLARNMAAPSACRERAASSMP